MGKAGKAILGAAIMAGLTAFGGAGFVLGNVTFLGLPSGLTSLFARAALGGIVSGLSGALGSKPKSAPASSLAYDSASRTQQIRQPISSWEIVYGEVRKSGVMVYGTSTASNKYMHLVFVIASHEVEAIDEIWLGDDVIPSDWLDTNGMVTQGKFAGKVRLRKHLGTDGQTADTALMAEVSEWTVNHRGRGRAYIYVRYELDRQLFPSGAPNLSAIIRGKKLYDPRLSLDRWSPHAALMAHDYLRSAQTGFKVRDGNIGETETIAASNACEEIVNTKTVDSVANAINSSDDTLMIAGNFLKLQRGDRVEVLSSGTLPGGVSAATDYYVIPWQWRDTPRIKLALTLADSLRGLAIDITSAGSGAITVRKNGEPRYFGGGVISTAKPIGDNLKDMLSAMAGKAVETGGLWKLYAGVWRTPALTLTENDLIRPIQINTHRSLDERHNAVKGVYVSPINNWIASDYPIVRNAAFLAADLGEAETRDLDQPFTQRPSQAQRIATIALNLHRQEFTVPIATTMRALQVQPGSVVNLILPRYGWEDKSFEVDEWRPLIEGDEKNPTLGVEMMLQEAAAGVYSWSTDSELLVDPAPNTTLPSVFTPEPPTGLSIDSTQIDSRDSDAIYQAVVHWTPHPNAFVRQGGQIQFEYRVHGGGDTDWIASRTVWGDAIQADLFTGSLGTIYDIRARAVNSKGIPSNWNAALSGFTLGTSGGISAYEDYGSAADAPTTNIDHGSVADAPGTSNDYGGVNA